MYYFAWDACDLAEARPLGHLCATRRLGRPGSCGAAAGGSVTIDQAVV
jgi:hypothetical protein